MNFLRRVGRWTFGRQLCFGGLVGALAFFVISVSPSLLPRGWLFQGIVSGINLAVGYGLGSAASAMVRAGMRRADRAEPSAQVKRYAWWGLLGAAVVAVPLALWWGNTWNQTTREIMGMKDLDTWSWGGVLVLAVLVFAIVMIIARIVRGAARLLIRFLERWIPRRISMAVGTAIVAIGLIGGTQSLIIEGAFGAVNQTYSLSDLDTTPGFVAPQSPLRSGSSESLLDWDDLGTKGRDFVGDGGGGGKRRGPTADEIEQFNGEPAMEPIRAYVGLRSADSLDERVELAMAELERTNAFDRSIVAVFATTGTGWVDERMADSLEYIWGGDTAAVALQYSYLPSWVSIFVDGQKAADTSEAMIMAVRDRIDSMPEAEQPKLLVFGESLGSFATETAFDELDVLIDNTEGALFVGPTFVNDLRNDLTANRDEGSPEWRPVVDNGRQVRFAVLPEDLEQPDGPWDEPRIVYLQNSSDPISFFSFDLLWSQPDWLNEPRAPDANPDMFWFPVVTFTQTLADLTYSFGAPAGHGHRYGANVADGWVAIGAPPGWTDDDTQRLRDVVGHE